MTSPQPSQDTALEALGNTLTAKHPETEMHSKRVTAFAIAICRSMRLSKDETQEIAWGAFLHDIGKITIPDSILENLTS
jgi:HD-GYP domain-containing protein (c-di-GMP phosphodiesterase class II)